MMFPVHGGMFNGVNKKIRKHNLVPEISPERICIKSCGGDDWDDSEMTTPEPPGIGYNVEIKIVNLGESYKAPEPGSEEFRQFSNTIDDNLKSVFKKVPGYRKMTVDNIVE